MKAPVVLFAYNRPEHLRSVLVALASNHGFDETPVFVCSDGPKRAADAAAVEAVRRLVRDAGHANVTLVESGENQGLYRSITGGVSRCVNEFGRVIVLEDDLLTSPHFLQYMNAALDRYVEAERVLQVCGFGVHVEQRGPEEAFFSPLASSWGWGTWSRAWDGFMASDPAEGYQQLRASSPLRRRFDLGGRYPMYFMLRRNLRQGADSWAVFWQLYVFLQEGLALWPSRSLVRNLGSDGQGTHSRWSRKDATSRATELADRPVRSFPRRVELDAEQWCAVVRSLMAGNPFWHPLLSAASRRFL